MTIDNRGHAWADYPEEWDGLVVWLYGETYNGAYMPEGRLTRKVTFLHHAKHDDGKMQLTKDIKKADMMTPEVSEYLLSGLGFNDQRGWHPHQIRVKNSGFTLEIWSNIK